MATCKRKSLDGLCTCPAGTDEMEVQPLLPVFSLLRQSGIDASLMEDTLKNALGIPSGKDIPSCERLDDIGRDVDVLKINGVGIDRIDNLDQFPNLLELEVTGNRITSIDGKHLPPSLRVLDARWNPVTGMRRLENVPGLEVLRLAGTKPLEGIREIAKLPEIEEVDFSARPGIVDPGKKIGDLPVGNMAKKLDKNDLVVLKAAARDNAFSIQDIAGSPPDLCEPHYGNKAGLLMNGFDLSGVPTCATRVPASRMVFSNNNITSIGNLVGKPLSTLKKLYLDGNKLTKMERLIAPGLEVLDMSNNDITTIENLYYPRLKELDLKGNKIASIGNIASREAVDMFDVTKGIERLDLSRNKISTEAGLKMISKFKKLKSLDLSGNPLTRVRCPAGRRGTSISLRKEMGRSEIKKLKKCL